MKRNAFPAAGRQEEKDSDKENTASRRRVVLKRGWITTALMILYDIMVFIGSYFLALWIRFDMRYSAINPIYYASWTHFVPFYAAVCIVVFWSLRLYKSVWRFASYNEMLRLVIANLITGILHAVGITVLYGRMPIFYYVVGFLFQSILTTTIRFSYRLFVLERRKRTKDAERRSATRVMMIGAGAAGRMILREIMFAKELNERVVCIIDDDPDKQGRYIDGVRIAGGREDIFRCAEKYRIDRIYVAIPTLTPENRREILNLCSETGCELKSLPAISEIVSDEVKIEELKKVGLEDLIGREAIEVNTDEISRYLSGKVVLVTGGGGSIGSELCRRIAENRPKKLIIFDIYENNAYSIQLELQDRFPELDLAVAIGSVRDSRRLDQVFAEYRPEIVYHAAAHKHVPLMEDNPCEAIKNNAIGTYKTAYAAMRNGCRRFVLISTDKAVNPTNVMGASKRLCEMVIQAFDRKIKEGKPEELPPFCCHSGGEGGFSSCELSKNGEKPKTEFVAVRFGNVLGSNGSVIPRFEEQIARGGPVTVTHPDVIRYFMSIPEAVALVLQAGIYAEGGEIFVLDMGSPVRIDTLARNLIRLAGKRPDVDIRIEYVGLRPGEKLYEEKLMSEEGLRTTPNHLIHVGSPIPFDTDAFLKQLDLLMRLANAGDGEAVRRMVCEMVPTCSFGRGDAPDGAASSASDPERKKE